MTTTATKQVPIPLPSRMKLEAVKPSRREQPIRAVIYGPEGCGKTTFAANAPKPIFIGAEDGTAHVDVQQFPTPESWTEVLEAIRVLTENSHDFESLAIDTLDWVEPLIWAHICKRDGQTNIEEYGYSKGYTVALDEWRIFLAALERLRRARPMNVLLIAHSWIKSWKNPDGPDYDRYELKLHNKAAGLLKEWCDAVLFANLQTFVAEDKRTKRVRGLSSGARLLFTERTATYDAKNRYGLPPSLPLDWNEFATAVKAGRPVDPRVLRAEIERKAEGLIGELKKTVLETLAKAGDNTEALVLINNRVNARLNEQEEKTNGNQ